MNQDRITVAGITPPAVGKKQGKVIDTVGRSWNVWGDKLANYQMGKTYDITYEVNEFNDAKFNVIKTLKPVMEASGLSGPGMQQPAQAAVQRPIGTQTTQKDEMIFVCGIINNAVANQNINPFELTATELITMVEKARQVWRNTFGKVQAVGDDLGGYSISF